MKAALFFVVTTMIVTASPVLALFSDGQPKVGELALVVASPLGPSIAQILMTSGAQEAYPGRAPIGAFVVLEDASSITSLKNAGAVLVLSGKRISALC